MGNGICGMVYTVIVHAQGNRSCSEDFFLDETTNLCLAVCGEWRPQSADQVQVLTIIILTSGATGVLLSIVVVTLSCLHYKTM